ncbi:hypothetical protein H6P81_003355 [Aristolochia fimbriata]|uniref:Integrase catalytic domain-containing protein n=1 Tax=Aristolochia fimbriata TaxID=158543 RepID=A0AAV7FFN1_ARIFI|nr:hypothetical protein H6P81_003355 [Aristolochia fimbriata]
METSIQQWDGVLESIRILKEHLGVLEQENAGLKKQIGEMKNENQIPTDEEKNLRELVSSLEKDNHKLRQEIVEKEKVILKLEEDLRNSEDILKKFDKVKKKLDDILIQGRRSCDRQEIDYSKMTYNKTLSRKKSSRALGLVQTESIVGKRYVLVCVDDFSRFTWVEFIREKSDTYKVFASLCRRLMTEKNVLIGKIIRIRSDHGREFENNQFAKFCEKKGISHEFSAPKTPQQNGVFERKNITLQVMARAMISSKNLPHKLWAEAVNTACYISNRVHLRHMTNKTPYELWKGRKPKVHYFREFGSTCYVLRDHEQLGKFDSRSTEGIFIGYSRNNHAYRVYFRNNNTVIETVNVEIADQNENLPVLDDEQGNMPKILTEKTSTNLDTQSSEQVESHTHGEESSTSDDEVEEDHENTTDIGS